MFVHPQLGQNTNIGTEIEGTVYKVNGQVCNLALALASPDITNNYLADLLSTLTFMYRDVVFVDYKIGPFVSIIPAYLQHQQTARLVILNQRPEGQIFNQILRVIIERDSSYPLAFVRGTTDELFSGIQTALIENGIEIYDSFREAIEACFNGKDLPHPEGRINNHSAASDNRLG